MQKITITVTDEGTRYETSGFSGPACLKATEPLKQALGPDARRLGVQPTAEATRTATRTNEATQ